jgi:glycosyltransferase involved in cell wall biosynthesis
VHHGLPLDLLQFHPRGGDYLAFLGRISPEKRADRAIEIATKSGWPLKIAAKIDRVDREYHERVIRPLLDSPGIEYIGEISEQEKGEFLGNAAALLFPIDWPEPFGLVMIESLACGTPVIAWRRGSAPEVIEHGATGFLCETIDEGVEAVELATRLSRGDCRRAFETRFSIARMAADYVRLYERIINHIEVEEVKLHGRDHHRPRPVLHPGDIVEGR